MRYTDPNLSEQLAAEYVLGTLRGRARKRFERLLPQYPHLQQKVEEWNLSINKLAVKSAPVEPPEKVWRGIEQVLFESSELPWYKKISLWQSLTLGSSLLAGVLAIMLFIIPAEPQANYVLLLSDNIQQAGWSVSASKDMEQFFVDNLKPMKMPENQGCMLWVQPAGSNAIYPLGHLPDDGGKVVLPIAEPLRDLLLGGKFIVTVETLGVPFPDAPTTPSEFTGKLRPLTSI